MIERIGSPGLSSPARSCLSGDFVSGYATVGVAVSAIKELGAFTCLQKETFQREEFVQMVQQALNHPPRVGIRRSEFRYSQQASAKN